MNHHLSWKEICKFLAPNFIFFPTKFQHEKQQESFVYSLCLILLAYSHVFFTVTPVWFENLSERQKSAKETASFRQLLFCKFKQVGWSHGRCQEICWDKPTKGATKQIQSYPEQVTLIDFVWRSQLEREINLHSLSTFLQFLYLYCSIGRRNGSLSLFFFLGTLALVLDLCFYIYAILWISTIFRRRWGRSVFTEF